ncbi:MAG: hypothetical protein JNJ88_05335 [Planctomycetes bacterium]|nr:hypothetical protein [Planctomycetota bacterium]
MSVDIFGALEAIGVVGEALFSVLLEVLFRESNRHNTAWYRLREAQKRLSPAFDFVETPLVRLKGTVEGVDFWIWIERSPTLRYSMRVQANLAAHPDPTAVPTEEHSGAEGMDRPIEFSRRGQFLLGEREVGRTLDSEKIVVFVVDAVNRTIRLLQSVPRRGNAGRSGRIPSRR